MAQIHFIGPLIRRGNYYCVEFPRYLSAGLRSRARIKVTGTINGGDYDGSAFPTGDGRHFIMINARMRQVFGIYEGEDVVVVVDLSSGELLKFRGELWQYRGDLRKTRTICADYFAVRGNEINRRWARVLIIINNIG